MKIQIDTIAKVIKLEQSAKITELLDVVKKLFPENEWKNYMLETNTVINNWSNPIYVDRWHPWPYDWPWISSPCTFTSGYGTSTVTTTNQYNGEINTSNFTIPSTYCIETN